MLSREFLAVFKRATEAKWSQQSMDPSVYGFQFQRGTRWNPGLADDKIAECEHDLGVRFPDDFRVFLRALNGTDLPTLNIYGNCGEPQRTSVGVYSYPRDLGTVKERIDNVRESWDEIVMDLAEQGFDLPADAELVPIYAHRYVVCTSNLDCSVVLSIVVRSTDAIVYGKSLEEYLEREFLR